MSSNDSKSQKLIPVGIVLSLIGIVTVVGVDGVKRILGIGDKLTQGDTLTSGENGETVIGFADGTSIRLGSNGEAVLDSDVFDLSLFGDDADISELLQDMQAAILAGLDPSAILDAAAAGELTNSEGNTTHVRVAHDASDPDAAISFETESNPAGRGSPDYQMPEGTDALASAGIIGGGGENPGGGGEDPGSQLPFLNISNVSIKEPASAGTSGKGSGSGQGPGSGSQQGTTKVVEFTVTLSAAQAEAVTMHFNLNDISADRGVDYSLINPNTGEANNTKAGVIEIPAGETSASISVVVYGDDVLEVEHIPEIFTVELSDVSIDLNVASSDFLGVGEIYDNEPGTSGGRDSDYQGTGGADSTPGDNTPTEGDDVIHGTGSNDVIDGLEGNDVILGAGGDDRLSGGDDNDILEGKGGDDQLQGDAGNDVLDGGAGDDQLSGNTGDDLLAGQIGDDQLLGNQGDDVLIGGKGADVLNGGGGADVFKYTNIEDGGDTIQDFKPNQGDTIDISELLDGYSTSDPIENWVKVEANADTNDAFDLHVNPTGDVGGDFSMLATVHISGTGQTTDVDDLINAIVTSNQIT